MRSYRVFKLVRIWEGRELTFFVDVLDIGSTEAQRERLRARYPQALLIEAI